jgi:hypothetical protein
LAFAVLLAAGTAGAGAAPVPLTPVLDDQDPSEHAVPAAPEKCPESGWVCLSVNEATARRDAGSAARADAAPRLPFLTAYTAAVARLEAACRDDRPARTIRLYFWRAAHDEPQASVPIPPAAWSGFACLAALAGFKVLRRRSLRSD